MVTDAEIIDRFISVCADYQIITHGNPIGFASLFLRSNDKGRDHGAVRAIVVISGRWVSYHEIGLTNDNTDDTLCTVPSSEVIMIDWDYATSG